MTAYVTQCWSMYLKLRFHSHEILSHPLCIVPNTSDVRHNADGE